MQTTIKEPRCHRSVSQPPHGAELHGLSQEDIWMHGGGIGVSLLDVNGKFKARGYTPQKGLRKPKLCSPRRKNELPMTWQESNVNFRG